MQIDYLELYKSNEDFKQYVDKYCVSYNKTLSECLEVKLVRIVGRYYLS